jgi:hypothetical protein
MGRIIDVGAVLMCPHGGSAAPSTPSARVLVGGRPVVTADSAYVVTSCRRADAAPPCTSGRWVTGAARVLVGGVPVAVDTGASATDPSGVPMHVVAVQHRVTAR